MTDTPNMLQDSNYSTPINVKHAFCFSRQVVGRCKTLRKAKEQLEEHSSTFKAKCLQILVIPMCLVFFWSLTFLFMEAVTFFVEMVVYTLMGVIVNAGSTLQYAFGEFPIRLCCSSVAQTWRGRVAKTLDSGSIRWRIRIPVRLATIPLPTPHPDPPAPPLLNLRVVC